MKKWMVSGLCLYCLFALFLAGCKTPPKDTKPADETPVQTSDNTEVVQSGTDVKSAAEKLKTQMSAARKKAVDAGAVRYFPDELTVVDTAAAEARSVYDAGGSPADFNRKASDIVYQYNALEQASVAYSTRKKVNDMKFADSDRASYDAAEQAFAKAEKMFNEGAAGKDLYAQMKTAADKYNAVLNAGYKSMAEKERDKVLELKQKADAVKTGVADKNGYASAVAFYTRANQELQSGQAEKAYNDYISAYGALDKVYQAVLKKRAAAENAMERAKRRVEEADAVAEKADNTVPVDQVEALAPVDNASSAQEAQ